MNPIFIARKSVFPLSLRVERRWPAIQTSPDVKSSIPDRQFRRVVLPHPDGPITATISPLRTSRSRPRSAWTAPPPLSYVLTRRRATTMRSSVRGALAGVTAAVGTVMDSEDIGGRAPGPTVRGTRATWTGWRIPPKTSEAEGGRGGGYGPETERREPPQEPK